MPEIVSHSNKLLTAPWGNTVTSLVYFSALNKAEYFSQSWTPAIVSISVLFGLRKGHFKEAGKEEFKLPR